MADTAINVSSADFAELCFELPSTVKGRFCVHSKFMTKMIHPRLWESWCVDEVQSVLKAKRNNRREIHIDVWPLLHLEGF